MTPEECYRRNVAVSFLERISFELDSRFSDISLRCSSLLGLVPSVLLSDDCPDFKDVIAMYNADLPSPDLMERELVYVRSKYNSMPPEERPSTAAEALKDTDAHLAPNYHTLLRICCTLPVTSCECERSGSALRRLHTYLRASMHETRLCALALMHIHYGLPIDTDEVYRIFMRKKKRMVAKFLTKR